MHLARRNLPPEMRRSFSTCKHCLCMTYEHASMHQFAGVCATGLTRFESLDFDKIQLEEAPRPSQAGSARPSGDSPLGTSDEGASGADHATHAPVDESHEPRESSSTAATEASSIAPHLSGLAHGQSDGDARMGRSRESSGVDLAKVSETPEVVVPMTPSRSVERLSAVAARQSEASSDGGAVPDQHSGLPLLEKEREIV